MLDGQQRIRTIIDFMNDEFSINGYMEPIDDEIVSLNGRFYSGLPDSVKSRFKRFTITTVRLREYRPDEPGELFFRLNQLTALTAAEQRNALVGIPRNQVKELSNFLLNRLGPARIGFSNARLNYDDVLSRLCVVIEEKRLETKLTSQVLERRYRDGRPFRGEIISTIENSIEIMSSIIEYRSARVRLNKASMFSWLYFICDLKWPWDMSEGLREPFYIFEGSRIRHEGGDLLAHEFLNSRSRVLGTAVRECITIFNDRAASRVNDVSSVLLRDLCLNVSVFLLAPQSRNLPKMKFREPLLAEISGQLESLPEDVSLRSVSETSLARFWETRREASTN